MKNETSCCGKTFRRSKGSTTTGVIINGIVIDVINYKVKAIVSWVVEWGSDGIASKGIWSLIRERSWDSWRRCGWNGEWSWGDPWRGRGYIKCLFSLFVHGGGMGFIT